MSLQRLGVEERERAFVYMNTVSDLEQVSEGLDGRQGFARQLGASRQGSLPLSQADHVQTTGCPGLGCARAPCKRLGHGVPAWRPTGSPVDGCTHLKDSSDVEHPAVMRVTAGALSGGLLVVAGASQAPRPPAATSPNPDGPGQPGPQSARRGLRSEPRLGLHPLPLQRRPEPVAPPCSVPGATSSTGSPSSASSCLTWRRAHRRVRRHRCLLESAGSASC